MATPMSAAVFKAALKAEGLTVKEHAGWSTHHRPARTGDWGPLNGVMIHHTASGDGTGITELCYNGRSDLPGPLCHGVIHKDGTITLVGWGRANHAGKGDGRALTAVINEASVHPKPGAGTVDGNPHFVGFECVNRGDGRDPWPEKQLDAIARAAAGVCRHYGWGAHSVIGHLEWTNQKIDPRGFPMSSMRIRIGKLLAAKPGGSAPIVTPPKETGDMPSTLGLYDTTDRALVPAKWTTVPVEHVDLLTDARAYSTTVMLTLTAPVGSTIQGRFYHLRTDNTRWESGVIERPASLGSTFIDFHHEGGIAPSEKLRFEVAYFPVLPTDTKPIVISTARARGLYWK